MSLAAQDYQDARDLCYQSGRWNTTLNAEEGHTVGLREDGTIAVEGSNQFGQCYVPRWKNIRVPSL